MNEQGDALAEQTGALQVEVGGLRVQVERLGQRMDGFREDLTGLGDRTRRTEGNVRWVAMAAVVALLLGVAIGVTAWRGFATDQRLDAICPVLALVVGGADPSTRPAGAARDRYITSIDVMRKSYVDLGCERTSPLVPPRVPGS